MIAATEENELLDLVRSINIHMNSVLNRFYAPYGLTRPQAIVLSEIEVHGPMPVGILAQKLNMTTSNLCLIAQRLERSGFLHRRRDPHDQRSVILTATDQCHQLIHEVQAHVSQLMKTRLEYADPENMDKIMEGLRLLNAVMLAHEDQGETQCD